MSRILPVFACRAPIEPALEPSNGCLDWDDLPPSRQVRRSGQVPDADAISAFGDDDLGVLAIAQIAMKRTDPVAPTHLVPGTPDVTDAGLWSRPPGTPLTCLARLPGRQSLPTGHLGPLWQGPVWRISD